MTPTALVFGTLATLFAIIGVVLLVPLATDVDRPSDILRARTLAEERGHQLYLENGCTFCHSQHVRRIDWGPWAERVSEPGDYLLERPHLFGTERTGPDLTQAGGQRHDHWHVAHFVNPRFTRPESIMPGWEFLGTRAIDDLTAYVQSLGFEMADARMQRQRDWHLKALAAYRAGPDENVRWLHSLVPATWLDMPSPYPGDTASLARGHAVYQQYCLGCHGSVGDGLGPAEPYIEPPPLNFTTLRRAGVSGGVFYYQIMNGITGTAMPYFYHELESQRIWDVGNFVTASFVSGVDTGRPQPHIDSAHEPPQPGPGPAGSGQ